MSPNPLDSPSIAVSDLNFTYRQAPVIVGLRWEVAPGSLVALTGLSGSGKSTLLALLAGVLRPGQGRVLIQGGDPQAGATRSHIGYMPQEGGLYPDLTVEDNLRIFGAPGQAGTEELEGMLDFLALKKRRHEPVKTLSAGWRHRVSLGAALLSDPFVLLLDEPFADADPEFTERAWARLRALAERGRTIVVATSQVSQALRANSLAVLRAGRLVFQGSPEELSPAGKAKVVMRFRAKTGPFSKEVAVNNYQTELVGLLTGLEHKPAEVEIQADTPAQHLIELLTKDQPNADLQP